MHYDLSFDNFTAIPLQSGTIQNINCRATVEISTSNTENTGLVLYPEEKYQWTDKIIYARAKWSDGEAVRIAVEPFVCSGGGGGGGSTVINNVEEWKPNYPYSAGTLVIYNNTLYKATTVTNKPTFDPDDWVMIGGSGSVSEWAANTPYSVNDIVVKDGKIYVCTTAHTSGTTFDESMWSASSSGSTATMLYDWEPSKNYVKDEIVNVGGFIYRCKNNHISTTSFVNDINRWELMSWVDWTPSTQFIAGQIVYHNGNQWRCLVNHVSSAIGFVNDMIPGNQKWEQIGGGATAGWSQVTKLDVTAPQDVDIAINQTLTFNRPPAEVLKFASGSTNVTVNQFTFSAGDGSKFTINGVDADDSQLVTFDGVVKPNHEFKYEFGGSLPVANGYYNKSDAIDLSEYKVVSEVNVE